MGKKLVVNHKISHNLKRGPIKNGKKTPKGEHVGKSHKTNRKNVTEKIKKIGINALNLEEIKCINVMI